MHLFNDYTKILTKTESYVVYSTTARSSHYLARSSSIDRAFSDASDLFCTIHSTYSHPLDRSSSPRLVERPSDFLATCCLDQATLINRFKLQTIHIRHIFIDPLQSTRQSIFDYMFKVNVIINDKESKTLLIFIHHHLNNYIYVFKEIFNILP